jgi:WD40 repeat protein
MSFSPDGRTLALDARPANSFEPYKLYFRRAEDGALLGTVDLDRGYAIAPDWSVIAAVVGDFQTGLVINLRSIPGGQILRTLIPKSGSTYSPVFSRDGTILAGLGGELWRVSDGAQLGTLKLGAELPVEFSPDGKTLFTAGALGAVGSDRNWSFSLRRVPDGTVIWTHTNLLCWQSPRSADWSTWATVTVDGSMSFWRMSDGALTGVFSDEWINLVSYTSSAGYASSVAFSPDGSFCAYRVNGAFFVLARVPGAVVQQPRFDLGSMGWASDKSMRLMLTGLQNRTYTLQSSENLRDWTDNMPIVSSNGMGHIIDAKATNSSHRFYRARQEP